MRLLRLVIWLATLFFAVMLFLPLVRQIIRRVTESGGSGLP
jgi:preprotein translocase subunit SecG